MSFDPQQAFDQIKDLESQGKIPAPAAQTTVRVGTFDAHTGKFSFLVAVKNVTWLESVGDPRPGSKPIPPIKHTTQVGEISVNAADLQLVFVVSPADFPFSVQIGSHTASINQPAQNLPRFSPADTRAAGAFGGGPLGPVNASHGLLTLDVADLASSPLTGQDLPGVTVRLWSGVVSANVQLLVERPPLVAAGAFLIPALPVGIIYAPPVGAQNKNFAELTQTTSLSTKITSGFSQGNQSKQATAYTATDFIEKISGIISATSSAAGAGTQGAAIITAALGRIESIIGATTVSTTDLVTNGTEHDLTTTITDSQGFGTPAGLGPGSGDRFVYLSNVRVAYVIAGARMSFTVLGHDGTSAFPAKVLLSDLAAIAAGTSSSGPATTLDAAALQSLLNLDPLVAFASQLADAAASRTTFVPPLPSPRFVLNDPPSKNGNGTDPNGDFLMVTHDVNSVDISTRSSVQTTVTNFKPGWLVALFGSNVATEDQLTLTYSSSSQVTVDEQRSTKVTFFASPDDPPYSVGIRYDRLFGTLVFTPQA